jgi:hypothetical protein
MQLNPASICRIQGPGETVGLFIELIFKDWLSIGDDRAQASPSGTKRQLAAAASPKPPAKQRCLEDQYDAASNKTATMAASGLTNRRMSSFVGLESTDPIVLVGSP